MVNEYEIRENTAVIFLKKTDGEILETVIDLDDLQKAMSIKKKWYAVYQPSNRTHYVCANEKVGRRKIVMLHRYLFDKVPSRYVVDHINHDTLDNRRSCNLRVVTQSENMKNRKPKTA